MRMNVEKKELLFHNFKKTKKKFVYSETSVLGLFFWGKFGHEGTNKIIFYFLQELDVLHLLYPFECLKIK